MLISLYNGQLLRSAKVRNKSAKNHKKNTPPRLLTIFNRWMFSTEPL